MLVRAQDPPPSSLLPLALDAFGYRLLLPDAASPKKTAAKTKKTTPTPEESRVKSNIAMMRNATPARALPIACLDISLLTRVGPRL
jgi:hypothetical protein